MIDHSELHLAWSGLPVPTKGRELETVEITLGHDGRSVFLARDAHDRVHVLVSCGNRSKIASDRSSRGVMLVGQPLDIEGDRRLFADLVCVDRGLQPIFEQLAADICGRISTGEFEPFDCLKRTLAEWRDFLRGRGLGPEYSKIIGLRGELELVRRIALIDPEEALTSWVGPSGAMHDFQQGPVVMEMKTTTAQSGCVVHIHGLRQLDPPPNQDLYLWLLRILPDDTAEGISDVVDDLLSIGVPRDKLMSMLELLGYRHDDPAGWEGSFRIGSSAVWHVHDEFPGIRDSRLPQEHLSGISDLTYSIDLDAGGTPLKPSRVEAILRSIASGTHEEA